jgi:hypothetical protein
MWVLQRLKVNILKTTILAGTFSLALAFAGNDLVNFIGVPLAGLDSWKIAQQTGNPDMLMGALNNPVKADTLFLILAGVILIAGSAGMFILSLSGIRVADTKKSSKKKKGTAT